MDKMYHTLLKHKLVSALFYISVYVPQQQKEAIVYLVNTHVLLCMGAHNIWTERMESGQL